MRITIKLFASWSLLVSLTPACVLSLKIAPSSKNLGRRNSRKASELDQLLNIRDEYDGMGDVLPVNTEGFSSPDQIDYDFFDPSRPLEQEMYAETPSLHPYHEGQEKAGGEHEALLSFTDGDYFRGDESINPLYGGHEAEEEMLSGFPVTNKDLDDLAQTSMKLADVFVSVGKNGKLYLAKGGKKAQGSQRKRIAKRTDCPAWDAYCIHQKSVKGYSNCNPRDVACATRNLHKKWLKKIHQHHIRALAKLRSQPKHMKSRSSNRCSPKDIQCLTEVVHKKWLAVMTAIHKRHLQRLRDSMFDESQLNEEGLNRGAAVSDKDLDYGLDDGGQRLQEPLDDILAEALYSEPLDIKEETIFSGVTPIVLCFVGLVVAVAFILSAKIVRHQRAHYVTLGAPSLPGGRRSPPHLSYV